MKKCIQFCLAAMVLVAFAACSGKNEVDPRDAFVGVYAYTATGNVDLYIGTLHWNVPLNDKGTFTVSKADDANQVVIEGYNESINATVSGNQLVLESNTVKTMYGDIELTLTFLYDKATLADNQLTWETDVQGIGRYSGYTATGEGHVSVVGVKQQN